MLQLTQIVSVFAHRPDRTGEPRQVHLIYNSTDLGVAFSSNGTWPSDRSQPIAAELEHTRRSKLSEPSTTSLITARHFTGQRPNGAPERSRRHTVSLASLLGVTRTSSNNIPFRTSIDVAAALHLQPPIADQCKYNCFHRQRFEVEYK